MSFGEFLRWSVKNPNSPRCENGHIQPREKSDLIYIKCAMVFEADCMFLRAVEKFFEKVSSIDTGKNGAFLVGSPPIFIGKDIERF